LDLAILLASNSVDAAMSLDVVLHLGDRLRAFMEVARVLRRGARAVGFVRYQEYLRSVISMSERGALSRLMYLTELSAD
jgi:methyltransferase family protein